MIPRNRNSAFTLIELLVAITITVGLAATMLMVTTGTLNLWRRTQDSFTTQIQAALVLDYLERDLQCAVCRSDGSGSMAVDILNSSTMLTTHGWLTSPLMKPVAGSAKYTGGAAAQTVASISSARFGLSGTWLRFITTNLEGNGSLPVAVSYQIVRRPLSGAISANNPAATRYSLFRAAVAADVTFALGPDPQANGYASTSASPSLQRSGPTVTNPNTTSDVIATNVVDFGIWLHRRGTAGELLRIFPIGSAHDSYRSATAADIPDSADVMVRILSEEGAKRLAALETGLVARPGGFMDDADWWWSVVEANSTVVCRRVQFEANSR